MCSPSFPIELIFSQLSLLAFDLQNRLRFDIKSDEFDAYWFPLNIVVTNVFVNIVNRIKSSVDVFPPTTDPKRLRISHFPAGMPVDTACHHREQIVLELYISEATTSSVVSYGKRQIEKMNPRSSVALRCR